MVTIVTGYWSPEIKPLIYQGMDLIGNTREYDSFSKNPSPENIVKSPVSVPVENMPVFNLVC